MCVCVLLQTVLTVSLFTRSVLDHIPEDATGNEKAVRGDLASSQAFRHQETYPKRMLTLRHVYLL
jgi:hypothetical protein